MPYRDERVAATAESYPDVSVDRFRIDILAAHFVQRPQHFDVVVARNLFGDILSDLGPACIGTIGIAPSANINPTLAWPSLFEPVHGSASDIAGRGIANPIAMVWSAALILDLLGHQRCARSDRRRCRGHAFRYPGTAHAGHRWRSRYRRRRLRAGGDRTWQFGPLVKGGSTRRYPWNAG